jgi:ribosomal protein L14E/L6E/L27E
MLTPVIGRVVISAAGRDKGRKMVIVGSYAGTTGNDTARIIVADGKERKLASPKRKNPKHLIMTDEVIDIEYATDKSLRRLFHG